MKDQKKLAGEVMMLAFLLRILFITSRGIQYDDAFSILLAQRTGAEIIIGTAADTMPPLYYFLLHAWMTVFQEIWWYRLLSVVLSMGALVFLYLIIKNLAGEKAAVWALLIGAVSPFQIYHAQDIRMYALLQFCQAGYVYAFLRWAQGERRPSLYRAGLIVAGAAALYTHNLAAFFLLTPNVYLLWMRQWKLLAKLIVSQLVMLILFLPWVYFLPGQLDKIQTAFWTPRPGLLEIFQAMITFTGSLTVSPLILLQIVAALSSLVFILGVVLAVRSPIISKNHKLLLFTLIFWTPFVLFILSYMMRPVFVPRAFITSSLFFFGLAGMWIAAVKPVWLRTIPGVAIMLAAVLSLPGTYRFDQFPRSPFEAAVAITQQDGQPDAIVIHDNKLSCFPGLIYYPEIRQEFLADAPGSANDTLAYASQQAMDIHPAGTIEQAAQGQTAIDYIVFTRTIREYQEMGYDTHPVIVWLNDHYRFLRSVQVGDLEVYRYIQ